MIGNEVGFDTIIFIDGVKIAKVDRQDALRISLEANEKHLINFCQNRYGKTYCSKPEDIVLHRNETKIIYTISDIIY
jgi:hypothetical protein